MKLKAICKTLAGEECPRKLQLTSCSDGEKFIDSFLASLIANQHVKALFVRTDFLTSLSEENILRFFRALAEMTMLEELIIQSSSRFHVEEIPPLGLLSLRQAQSLHTLELEDMQITANHKSFIAGLGMAILRHPSLSKVTMRNFFANDWANTDNNVLDPLLDAIGTLPNLQQLEFSGCGSHALSGQDVRLLSTHALAGVVGLKTLTHLEMSFLEMDDDHFETIADILKTNQSLLSIHLDYHKLGQEGFKSMMKALEVNRHVKTLSLRSLREISEEGFVHAMNTLHVNYGIEVLSITASPSQQAQIDLFLRLNGAGRGLLREPSVTMGDWVDVIAKSSDDIDLVRHLLQEIPGLCNVATLSPEMAESEDPARQPRNAAA